MSKIATLTVGDLSAKSYKTEVKGGCCSCTAAVKVFPIVDTPLTVYDLLMCALRVDLALDMRVYIERSSASSVGFNDISQLCPAVTAVNAAAMSSGLPPKCAAAIAAACLCVDLKNPKIADNVWALRHSIPANLSISTCQRAAADRGEDCDALAERCRGIAVVRGFHGGAPPPDGAIDASLGAALSVATQL